jgi:RPA family protein
MSESKTYKRFPAVRCWITHLLNGKYSTENKSLYTIFGQVKRVRIIATITEKREIINDKVSGESSFLDEEEEITTRIEFDLDDGTGLIRATLWHENPEKYQHFKEGNIVDIIGKIRNWQGFTSISPEIIKSVKDPNKLLLRDSEIIKRIKSGEIQQIPEISEEAFKYDDMTEELDVDSLFGDQNGLDIKESPINDEIFLMIKEYSKNGSGVSFEIIKKKFNLSEEELRNHLEYFIIYWRLLYI